MKHKLILAVASATLMLPASAALMQINNLVAGPGDTLYANSDNSLMSSGVVTIGYFSAGVNPTDIESLFANLGDFTIIDSQSAGTSAIFGLEAGYADTASAQAVPGGLVTGAPLLGRTIYSIVSSASSLAAATLDSEFGMVSLGVFLSDSPVENTYFSNPAGRTAIIGSFDTINTTTAAGAGSYSTFKMAEAIPEPSVALLGAFGVLGLLRRRR